MNNNETNNFNQQNVTANTEPVQPVTPSVNSVGDVNNNFNQQVNTSNYNPNATANQTGYVPANSPKVNFNIDKKFLAIGGITLAVIVLIVILFVVKPFGGKGEDAALKLYFDVKKPIIVEEDEKFGYVTYEGKKMIDIKYDYASEFYGKYAVVGMKDDEYDYSPSKYQVIDKKGKVKIETNGSRPKYYPEQGLWLIDSILYNSNFKLAFKKGIMYSDAGYGYFEYKDPVERKTGIINSKGKKVFSWDESEIDTDIEISSYDIDQKDVYAIVENDDDVEAIVSLKTGKIIYEVKSDDYSIYAEGNNIFSIDNYDTDEETWIYVKNGKILYEVKDIYSLDVYDYDKGILEVYYGYSVERDERYKYYDTNSKKMLDKEPDSDDKDESLDLLLEEVYGYRTFDCDDGYGLIKKEDIILSCTYDEIEFINLNLYKYLSKFEKKDIFLLDDGDNIIVYDGRSKKELIKFETYSVTDDESTFINAAIKENYSTKEYEVYNLVTGKSKTFSKDADIDLYSNYITVETDDGIVYYNAEFEKVYEIEFEKEEVYVPPVVEDDEDEVEENVSDESTNTSNEDTTTDTTTSTESETTDTTVSE